MNEDREMEGALRRLYGRVETSGVWAGIEARVVLGKGQSAKAGQSTAQLAGVPQVRSRRARLAVYAGLALLLVGMVAAGTVFGIDGGEGGHWEELILHTEGGEIYALALDPRDASILYAVGEDGVFKTVNGAASWELVRALEPEVLGVHGHYSIVVDPASSATVYLALNRADAESNGATSVRILRSDDSGKTWAYVGGVDPPPGAGPTSPAGWLRSCTLYADAGATSSTLYLIDGYSLSLKQGDCWRSLDQGKTWTKLEGAERQKVGATLKPSPSQVREVRWVQIEDAAGTILGFTTFGPSFCAVTDPADASVVYVGTGDGVCKSTDGGKSWTKSSEGMTHPAGGRLLTDPTDSSVLYVAAEQGVFKSRDRGATWEMMLPAEYNDSEGYRFTSVVMAPSAPSTLYAWTPKGLFRTDDGGATWSANLSASMVRSAYPDGRPGCQLLLVAGDDANVLFAVTDEGMVRSADGGKTWKVVMEPTRLAGVVQLVADPSNPSILYSTNITQRGTSRPESTVVKSVDKGVTWKPTAKSEALGDWSSLLVVDSEPSAIYTVGSGSTDSPDSSAVSRSLDGGSSWQPVDVGDVENSDIMQLAVDPRSPETMYVVRVVPWGSRQDGAAYVVSRSKDGGASWQDMGGGDQLSKVSNNGLTMNEFELFTSPLHVSVNDGTLYFSCGLGVFRWVSTEEPTSTSAAAGSSGSSVTGGASGSSGGLGCSAQ